MVKLGEFTINSKVSSTINKDIISDISQMTQCLLIDSSSVRVDDNVFGIVRKPIGGSVGYWPVSVIERCDLE
jgi:hypothetical protein